jgi:hypothetical protein
MTDRELLQQVLDAWQDHWVDDHQSALLEMIRANCANCARCGEKNPQREWQGLTDDEIKEIVGGWGSLPIDGYTRKLFDQIEAKLKEKNA